MTDKKSQPFETPFETPLLYHRFSAQMLHLFVRHQLNASTICVYHYLSLSQDINRSRTHKLKIEDIAEALDLNPVTVYKAIARLKEVGLFVPTDWGSVKGTLPYSQLVKHTAAQATHEKNEREFYCELREHITEFERTHQGGATRTQIQNEFTALIQLRKERRKYYPKADDVRRNLFDNLNRYAPQDLHH